MISSSNITIIIITKARQALEKKIFASFNTKCVKGGEWMETQSV